MDPESEPELGSIEYFKLHRKRAIALANVARHTGGIRLKPSEATGFCAIKLMAVSVYPACAIDLYCSCLGSKSGA